MTDPTPRLAVAPQGCPSCAPHSRAAAFRWPRNPYLQTALAYARRWPVRLAALWYLCFLLLATWFVYKQQFVWHMGSRDQQQYQMAHTPIDPERGGGVAAVALIAVMALFALPLLGVLFGAAREHVTDWRGTLLPHSRRPHLAFLAAATAAIVPLTASAFYAASPFSVPTLLAANLAIAALAGWCATLPPRGTAAVGLAAVALFALRPVRVEYETMLLHQDPTGAALALIAATLACAGVWVRLALIGESTAASRADDSLRLGHSLGFRRRTPDEHLAAMPLRRRVVLWRVPSSPGHLPAACATGLLALVVGLCLTQDRRHANNAPLAFPLAGLSVIVPMAAVASQWARRLPSLGYELSRPTTRRAFVRDLGLALAADLATWWAWLTAAGLAAIAFALLYMAPRDRPPYSVLTVTRTLAIALVTSLVLQFVLYAALAWVMRLQAAWAIYLLTVIGVIAAGFTLPYTLFLTSNHGPLAPAAILTSLTALGLLLTTTAHRHWLRTDLR